MDECAVGGAQFQLVGICRDRSFLFSFPPLIFFFAFFFLKETESFLKHLGLDRSPPSVHQAFKTNEKYLWLPSVLMLLIAGRGFIFWCLNVIFFNCVAINGRVISKSAEKIKRGLGQTNSHFNGSTFSEVSSISMFFYNFHWSTSHIFHLLESLRSQFFAVQRSHRLDEAHAISKLPRRRLDHCPAAMESAQSLDQLRVQQQSDLHTAKIRCDSHRFAGETDLDHQFAGESTDCRSGESVARGGRR